MITVEELQKRLTAWMKYREIDTDHRFYLPDEWTVRKGETVCADACLHLVSDGPLGECLGSGLRDDSCEVRDEFEKLLEKCGYWYEQWFTWSVHFYITDDEHKREDEVYMPAENPPSDTNDVEIPF